MSKKPTYEELQQKVKKLENKILDRSRQEDEFERIFNLSLDMIGSGNLDGYFTKINSSFASVLGWEEKDFLRKPFIAFVHDEDLETTKEALANAGKGKPTIFIENRYKCKDGSFKWIDWKVLSIVQENKFIAVGRDITERKKADKALRESEEKHKAIVENIEDGYYEVDLAGSFTFFNESMCKILGYSPDELAGINYRRYIDEENAKKVFKAFNRAYTTREPYKALDWELIRKDGSIRFVEASVALKLDSKDQPIGFRGIARDITGRKQAEDALRESEEQYRNLYDNALVGMWRSRISDGKLLKTNNVHAKMSGFASPEDALHSDFKLSSLYPAERRKELIELLKQNGTVSDFEAHLTYPDGREQYISISAKMFPPKDYIEGVVIDITERKRAEQALHESEEKFRTVVEKSPLGISLIGNNGRYKYINPQFAHTFGYTLEDIPTGTAWFNKAFPDNDYRHKVIRTWIEDKKIVNIGQTRPRVFMVTCKDGSRKEIHFRPVTMENLDQLVIYEDITEKSKMEHQFQQAQKFEAIGTLAGGIAHDFNNLLMGIQGRSSLMSADLDSSHPHMEHLQAIEDYIRSAVNLTKQLLGFARGGKYEVKPVNINQLVANSATMFGRTRKEIMIHTKMQPSPLVVEADQRQIEQVLLNLYVNAWQAMPDGGELYLETKIVMLDDDYCELYAAKPGRYAKVSVTDTGIGMNESTRQRVFDPFFTTKEKSRGTGLGLASAFGIIKNHGGIITVYSEIGHGATFNIYLPLSGKAVQDNGSIDASLTKGSETVLLVDDEKMITEVGQTMLERLGYRVVVANSGKQAIDIINRIDNEIDLVILDLIMPEMDGGRTFDRIREIRVNLPVILSSGYSINGKANAIMLRGCNGFIQKPFNLSELSQKIRSVLGKDSNPDQDWSV